MLWITRKQNAWLSLEILQIPSASEKERNGKERYLKTRKRSIYTIFPFSFRLTCFSFRFWFGVVTFK